jgi:amidase
MGVQLRQSVQRYALWAGSNHSDRAGGDVPLESPDVQRFWTSIALVAVLAPDVGADTHQFTPRQFFNTFSGAHPPVLRIKPGDRVVTKTIDAAGVDWTGKTVGVGPNPQTGPFFVEGAEPGDVLVVTFEKIETNRAMAYSASLLAPYTVDPQTIAARTDREPKRVTWTIDKARGIAKLDDTAVQPGGIELPLRPMLGCVGVAPPRKEAISTATPGSFGGNMDYARVTAGVTVMLPVAEAGALLFIGDGHARQGEGEVAGTGLETSMDVEFKVDLVKKTTIGWPRLENDTHIMVAGSARPLLEAFQHATSELQRWLMADFGMSERGAQTFMGQAAEYDIANVVDPAFTVVAKIPKVLLKSR